MGLLGIIGKLRQAEAFIDKVTPKVSLDTFMESVGDTIDKVIIRERENGLRFLGGKTHFSLSDDADKIVMRVELFFARSQGEFVKKETMGSYPVNMLNSNAHEDFIELLQSEGEYVVEVEEPQRHG